jgi:hypothetical protein
MLCCLQNEVAIKIIFLHIPQNIDTYPELQIFLYSLFAAAFVGKYLFHELPVGNDLKGDVCCICH